jgi:hypothetical protein
MLAHTRAMGFALVLIMCCRLVASESTIHDLWALVL